MPKHCVFVTHTVGEFRKLEYRHYTPIEYHAYKVRPEPAYIRAACIPCQDLLALPANPPIPFAIPPLFAKIIIRLTAISRFGSRTLYWGSGA